MLGRASVLAVVALALGSCSSGEEPARDPGTLFCQGLCRATVRCGLYHNSENCETDCRADRSGLVELSSEGAERLGNCLGEIGCDELTSQPLWEASFEVCWDEARVSVAPTPKLRDFCETYAAAWFECGDWYSTRDCEDAYGMWSDGVLDELERCTSQPSCEGFGSCVDATFGAP